MTVTQRAQDVQKTVSRRRGAGYVLA